jgi:hypothetical protein
MVTPQETGILSHVNVRKGISLPKGFGIAQSVSGYPRPASFRIDVLPSLSRPGVIIKYLIEAAEVRLRL